MGIHHGGIYGPVSDTAYDATSWDGVTSIAPSKNAVRDKLVTLEAALPGTYAQSNGSYAAVTTDVLTSKVTGDAFVRNVLNADGSTETGDGAAAAVLSSFTRTNSTAFGRGAGTADVSDTPTYLTAMGVDSLRANTTGTRNSAGGMNSLRTNTTGVNNSGFGQSVLYSNTTGSDHSAVGKGALFSPAGVTANATTTALRQTAIGVETGQASATQRNDIVCIGWQALVDGNNAIAIGSGASAGAAGAVAIGKDSANTSATTTVANEIKLGTALHTTNALGAMKVGKGFAAWGVAPPGAQPAAITAPTAPSAGYVQAEAQSAKTAIDAIRAALTGAGITL